jgi:ATP-dependent protease ClpP protease subunit
VKKFLTAILMLTITSSIALSKTLTLQTKNTIYINGEITSASVSQAIQDIVALDNKRGDDKYALFIVLKSPGGSIMDGQDLIRFANTIKNIHTVCIKCASMAHAISQGVKGTRLATPDNIMMAHRASGGFSGQFEDGELESQLQLFKSIVKSMEQRNANRIGISLKTYKAKVVNEWWTYAQESLDQNVVDVLVNIRCSKELINDKRKSTSMTPFGPIDGPEKSQCPLIP